MRWRDCWLKEAFKTYKSLSNWKIQMKLFFKTTLWKVGATLPLPYFEFLWLLLDNLWNFLTSFCSENQTWDSKKQGEDETATLFRSPSLNCMHISVGWKHKKAVWTVRLPLCMHISVGWKHKKAVWTVRLPLCMHISVGWKYEKSVWTYRLPLCMYISVGWEHEKAIWTVRWPLCMYITVG